jgi:hypothetical protein
MLTVLEIAEVKMGATRKAPAKKAVTAKKATAEEEE